MGRGRTLVVVAFLVPFFGSGCFDSCTKPANWRDEGAKVERLSISTMPGQMDEDDPLEQAVCIYGDAGNDSESRPYPFDADAEATVYRRVNGTGAEPWPNWTAETTWNFTIRVEEFRVSKSSSGPCRFWNERLYVDDDQGVDGELYMVQVVAVLRADGRQLEDRDIYAHQISFDP